MTFILKKQAMIHSLPVKPLRHRKGENKMAGSANYTPEERLMLQLVPFQAGVAVLVSAPSGLIGTVQETSTLFNSISKSAAQRYPRNSLIQDLLTGDTQEANKLMRQKIGMYTKDEAARKQAKQEAIQICRNVAVLLAQKSSPQEAEEYKKWVMDVCTKVASATAEEGQRISPAEEATIREIAQALNVTPSFAG